MPTEIFTPVNPYYIEYITDLLAGSYVSGMPAVSETELQEMIDGSAWGWI